MLSLFATGLVLLTSGPLLTCSLSRQNSGQFSSTGWHQLFPREYSCIGCACVVRTCIRVAKLRVVALPLMPQSHTKETLG